MGINLNSPYYAMRMSSGWIDTWLRGQVCVTRCCVASADIHIWRADATNLSKYHKVMHQQQYILTIFLFQENYDHLSGPIDKWSISKFVTFIFNHLLRSEFFSFECCDCFLRYTWYTFKAYFNTHLYTISDRLP